MQPTASRRTMAPPGGTPPGRLLFPRRRSSLAWLLPSVLVHLVILIAALSTSRRTVAVERPLPRWALALTPPGIREPLYVVLPPSPGALPLPLVARPAERSAVQPAPQPAPDAPGAAAPDAPGGQGGFGAG